MSTLAQRILDLDDGKRSTREIAELVYGEATSIRMAYVRAVRSRRRAPDETTRKIRTNNGYYESIGDQEQAIARSWARHRGFPKEEVRAFGQLARRLAKLEAGISA